MQTINRHMMQRACAILAIALWVPLGLAGCAEAAGRRETIKEPEAWHFDYVPFKPGNRLVKAAPATAFRFEGEAPRMTGAYALYPVYAAAFQALAAEPPEQPDDLERSYDIFEKRLYKYCDLTGSNVIFEILNEEKTDVIFGLRPAPGQIEAMRKAGLRYTLTPILREAFVFFVHKDNPATSLTQDQIRAIYSGKAKTWREVGVPLNARIAPYQRNKHSGSQTTLERIMGDTPIMEPPKEIYKEPNQYDNMLGIITKIGGFHTRLAEYRNKPAAIGFTFRFYANELIRNPNIKLLAIDGVAPTVENIENGSYPFITEAYAITARPREGNTAKIIDFLRSPEGRRMIEATGYTPVPEGAEDIVLE